MINKTAWIVLSFLLATTGGALLLSYLTDKTLLTILFAVSLFLTIAFWVVTNRKKRRK